MGAETETQVSLRGKLLTTPGYSVSSVQVLGRGGEHRWLNKMGIHYTEHNLEKAYKKDILWDKKKKKKKPQFTEHHSWSSHPPYSIILNVIYNYTHFTDEKTKMKRLNNLPKPYNCSIAQSRFEH